jgi:hypothetical protein
MCSDAPRRPTHAYLPDLPLPSPTGVEMLWPKAFSTILVITSRGSSPAITYPNFSSALHSWPSPPFPPAALSTQQHQDHTIAPQKHLTDKAILVDSFSARLASRPLRPHLLDVLEHHVAVAVEGFDAGEELAVIAARDEDLGVGAGGGLKDGQRAGGEFVGFEQGDFVFSGARWLDVDEGVVMGCEARDGCGV